MIRNTRIEAPRNRLVLCSSKFDQRGGGGGIKNVSCYFHGTRETIKINEACLNGCLERFYSSSMGGKKKIKIQFGKKKKKKKGKNESIYWNL